MHAARALLRHRQILLLDHMKFRGRTALAHGKHMNLAGRFGRGIMALPAHVHHAGQDPFGACEIMHVQHDRTEAANLVFRRHRTAFPWRGRTSAAVVDQHQALALGIFKRQRQPAVDLGDIADVDRPPF